MKYCKLRIGLAQIDPTVGDLTGNMKKILKYIEKGESENCDIILFPEMVVTGYPIQDLIFIHDFVDNNLKIVNKIKEKVIKSTVILGCITKVKNSENSLTPFHNSAAIIEPECEIKYVHKHLLPNYDVFDEKRYFTPNDNFSVLEYKGIKIGIEICEDLWDKQYTTKVTKKLKELGAQCILNINASPYYVEKPFIREKIIKDHVIHEKIPVVYLNMVGGQDEITFDGRSIVYDSLGRAIVRMSSFKEEFSVIDLPVPVDDEFGLNKDKSNFVKDIQKEYSDIPFELNNSEEIYKALVLNLRDYYNKVGIFKKAVVGLSGGIDSSFTAAIACAALGSENVIGILMPSKFSSIHSISDAENLCKNLKMEYKVVPIKSIHTSFEDQFETIFGVKDFTLADENLQSRIRGVILMYYSNKFDAILLSTGNKSEIAVGYCTLYGDTNGGKNIPGDLFKVDVYLISKWINEQAISEGKDELIPKNSIEKPPSAELRPNQTDQDSLPPYETLDAILLEFIENDKSFDEIIEMGFDPKTVRDVEKMYYNAEFKRAQLVQTIKISKKGFGIGRRIPVVNKYHYKRNLI